jgi:DNA invertase Pin-like site-specific DNA recombinase
MRQMGAINVKIYARVSTADQNVDQQASYLEKWAERNTYNEDRINLIGTVKDTERGSIPLEQRKKFKKLLEEGVAEGFSILIFNLDRLTRYWYDEAYLEKLFRDNWEKCKLISASESIDLSNATGRAMFRFKMVVNCLMPEDMREKQVVGIERAKKEGKYKGGKIGRQWANKV